jgi:hypothetical protein
LSTPLLLIHPIDGDAFCNKRPQLIWQPPFPLPSDARFRLVLAAVRDRQDIVEAVTYNPPLVNESNLASSSILYPANAPELTEGKKYAWQVIAYVSKVIIARSEVWSFEIKCGDNSTDSSVKSYRDLKETSDGNFYIATKSLHFSFNNPLSDGKLNYQIYCISDPLVKVKSLPGFSMQPGLNKYDLNLSENESFKEGEEYLLRVILADNRNLSLRFIYKSEDHGQ